MSKSITAISTPAGTGGIAIVRISGDDAAKIAFNVVRVKTDLNNIEHSKMYYGVINTGRVSDEVMAVYFRSPKSYTGEDLVEIHCHGSGYIAEEIVRAFIENGARAADNGEFTKRAFLNHKIDLTQAEAVLDLINSENVSQCNAAFQAVKGGLYKKIETIQNGIKSLTAEAEAAVDYPEEDLEDITKNELESGIKESLFLLNELIASYDEGRIIKEGIRVVIVGKANAGKSLLLNRLIGRDRAIVTDIEGTTRDTIEEAYDYKGIRFVVTDTAGLRETADKIEKLGIERSKYALRSADIVLMVVDVSTDNKEDNVTLVIPELSQKETIKVFNKLDLLGNNKEAQLKTAENSIFISALNNDNIDALKELLYNKVNGKKISSGGARLNNLRHYEAAVQAKESLVNAQNNLHSITLDCIISDLNNAYRFLGQITGLVSSKEIVEEIFKKFCVGK